MTDAPPTALHPVPLAEVLIIYQVNCACGAKFIYPAQDLLWEYHTKDGTIYDKRGTTDNFMERKEVRIHRPDITQCSSCYHIREDNSRARPTPAARGVLIHDKFANQRRSSKTLPDKRVKATPLDAF